MTRPDDSGIWQLDHSSLEHSVNIGQWSLATCLTGGRREEARVWSRNEAKHVAHGPGVACLRCSSGTSMRPVCGASSWGQDGVGW